jgi:Zinc knuckle
MLQLMRLETVLKTIDNWYEWAATLDHRFHKLNRAIEQTRGTSEKKKTLQFYFPRKERDLNAMDIDRLTINKHNKVLKEGRCFRCRNMGHRANKCPKDDDDKKKAKEVPKKKMNGRELHAHVQALFKEMMEEDRDEFLKGAKEAGF